MPFFYKVLLSFLFLITSYSYCQTVSCKPVFQKTYGGNGNGNDEGIYITYCSGGGMIVAGQTTSNSAGLYDGFLLKLADDGVVQWTRTFGGTLNDKLIKVRQTSDGGFIAIGQTKSFGNQKGETWMVRTDALGNTLWNKRYGNGSINGEKPKDIIQLTDGSFMAAINFNDSTTQSNAVLMSIGSAGDVLWSKYFDHGNDDGINNIAEWHDTLLVAGYATIDKRDAIVMKLRKDNGAFINAQKYTHMAGYNDEAINIEKTDSGIAFGITRYPGQWDYNNRDLLLTYFKQKTNGAIFYQITGQTSTGTGLRLENITCMQENDGGFLYLVNDTTPAGYSEVLKVGPNGSLEWGRDFHGFRGRTTGMDRAADNGYVFAGYKSDFFTTGNKNKVEVFKTDRVGKLGTCKLNLALDYTDTSIYTITPFTWNTVNSISLTASTNNMVVNTTVFTTTLVCEKQICDTTQILQDSCSISLVAEYKNELIHQSNDIEKLSDGNYMMAGHYGYYWSYEPTLTKLKPNGGVIWSKTYNDYFHNGYFWKVLAAPGGSVLAFGIDDYTINNGTVDSMIIMKIADNGNVIWCKKYGAGTMHVLDVKSTNDGGFLACIDRGYGNGSCNNYVARFNENGDFLWKKEIHKLGRVFHKLFYDGNSVYVAGNSYINNWPTEAVQIVKLDAQNGNLLWAKNYFSDGDYLNAEGFHKINDTIVLTVNIRTEPSLFQYRDATGFIKMKEDGSLISQFKLTSPNLTFGYLFESYDSDLRYSYIGKSNSDFVVAQQSSNSGDTSLIITMLNSSGIVKWSKKFPNLNKHQVSSVKIQDNSIIMTGKRLIGVYDNRRQFVPFFIKLDTSGIISNGATSFACVNLPFNTLVQNFAVTSNIGGVDSVTTINESQFYGYLNYRNYQPSVRNISTSPKVFCSIPSNCNIISIAGPDSICNIKDTIQYKLIRNTGCTAGAFWQIDTTDAQVFLGNDTTLNILFKHEGLISLKVSITSGCIGLTAQKSIFVQKSASTLNLGPDTVLCAGNSYRIKAGTGFKSYLWNYNNITDSVLIATQPGVYIVSVSDYCNRQFIDTVVITAANFPFSVGADTSKCNLDSIVLTATSGFTNYKWLPLYNMQSVSGNQVKVFPVLDTNYYVTAEKWAGCFVHDTVRITANVSPPVYLGNDSSICKGETITLRVQGAFSSYQWSTGATGSSITVSNTGQYSVKATAANLCNSKDTFSITSVHPLPIINLGNDTSICRGSALIMQPGNFTTFLWQDNSVLSKYTAVLPGTYWVKVTDVKGCSNVDTVRLLSINELPKSFIPDTLSFCEGTFFEVGTNTTFKKYTWSNGTGNAILRSDQPGLYTLKVTDQLGCQGSDTLQVTYRECYSLLYFPTAFTPNKDNLNDKFRPKVYGGISDFHLAVFSRWGEKVFETNNVMNGWDGTLNGLPQPIGAYIWTSNYKFEGANQVSHVQHGTVVLVR